MDNSSVDQIVNAIKILLFVLVEIKNFINTFTMFRVMEVIQSMHSVSNWNSVQTQTEGRVKTTHLSCVVAWFKMSTVTRVVPSQNHSLKFV